MICEVNLSDLLGASDRKMKSVNFSEGRARRGAGGKQRAEQGSEGSRLAGQVHIPGSRVGLRPSARLSLVRAPNLSETG